MKRTLLVLGLLVAAVACTAAGATTNSTGSIDVDKEVDGDPDCPDDEACFEVEIVCEDVTYRQTYDGSGHLIKGDSTYHDIPSGDVCVVTETETGGATVTYDPGQTVVITPEDHDSDEDQRVHVLVTNTFCEEDEDCQPPPSTTVPTTTVPDTTVPTTTVPDTTVPPPTSSIPPPTTVPPPPTTVPPPPTTDPPTTTAPPTTDPPTTTEPPLSSIVTIPPTTDPPTTDPCEDDDDRDGCRELARTGSDIGPWTAAGLIALTLGAALLVVTRKRVTG